MNIKQSIVRAIAVVGVLGALTAPAALADEQTTADNTKQAIVSVATPGVFNAYFQAYGSALDLGSASLIASSPTATKTGSVYVEYTDTKANRGDVNVDMSATDFQGYTVSGANTIAASNFTITSVGGVTQTLGGGGYGNFINNPGSSLPLDGAGTNIHDAIPGIGTEYSYGLVNLSLFIPNTTVQDNYYSVMTLTVTANAP